MSYFDINKFDEIFKCLIDKTKRRIKILSKKNRNSNKYNWATTKKLICY